MTQEEKILFVAAVSLSQDQSACPIWLEGDVVVYPEPEQVFSDESVFVAVDPAYQEALKRGFSVSATAYVAARQGERVFLYQISEPTERGSRLSERPFANPLLSRHLLELGLESKPFHPGALSRPSSLAERQTA